MATSVNTSTQQYFGFDPRTIPGCILWLDGADSNTLFSDSAGTTLVGSSGNVGLWRDKSLSSNNYIQSTAGDRPSFLSNTITCSASTNQRLLASGTASNVTGIDAFIVGKPLASTATWRTLFRGNLTDHPILIESGSTRLGYYVGSAGSFFQFNSPTALTLDGSARTLIYLNIPATRIPRCALNGTATASSNTTALGATATFSSIGNNFAGGQPWGDMNEIIFISNVTSNERQQVEGYLAWKWGLQANLPLSHQLKSNPTTMRVFQPIDIDSCVLWLDAADLSRISPVGITSGTAITSWADKSATATSAIPERGASGIAPVFSNVGGVPSIFIDNNNSVNFNASTYTQLSVQSNIQTTADYTIFAVINLNSTPGANQTIYSNRRATPVGETRAPQMGAGSTYEANTAATTFRQLSLAFIGTGILQTCLVSSTNSFSQNKNGSFYGEVVGTLTTRYTADASPFPTIGGTFSTSGSDNRFTTGHFHEIIAYNKALSSSERQRVEGYLTEKWRTPALPASHPYYLQRVLPSTPVFTPAALSGLALWLDSADSSTLTLSGTNVTQWRDKSTFGRNTTTYVNAPTFSNAAVRFSTNQGLNTTLSASTNVESGFIICGFTNPATGVHTLLGSGNGDGGRQFRVFQSTLQTIRQSVANVLTTGSALSSSITYLCEFVNNGTTLTHYLNGGVYASGAAAAYTGGLTTSIGYRNGPNEPLSGYIQEIVMFNVSVTDNQRQQVEGYLAWKWGLQNNLLTTHPYYKFRP